MKHRPVPPPHQPHNGVIVSSGEPQVMGHRMPQLMDVDRSDARLGGASLDGFGDPVGGHDTLSPKPEGFRATLSVPLPHPQVSVDRAHGLGTDSEDPWGNRRAGFSATTEIDREEFGASWNLALEAGGWLVSKTVQVEIDVLASLQTDQVS